MSIELIEELWAADNRIAELEQAATEFAYECAVNHSVHVDNMIGGSTRRALMKLNEVLSNQD